VGVKEIEVCLLFDLPADMQRVILGYVPLADLARLACLSKELRTAYVERVTKRDTAVTALLESHFLRAFRKGLTPAQTALPRDLVVHPPVRALPARHPSPPPSFPPPSLPHCLPTRTRADEEGMGRGGCLYVTKM
jgi:hypothetical protein